MDNVTTSKAIVPTIQPKGLDVARTRRQALKGPNSQEISPLLAEDLNEKNSDFSSVIHMLAQNSLEKIENDWKNFEELLEGLNLDNKYHTVGENAEKNLEKLIKESTQNNLCSEERFNIEFNLIHLITLQKVKDDDHIASTIILLQKLFAKERLLSNIIYNDKQKAIADFREKYKLSVSDNIFRYAIGFNTCQNIIQYTPEFFTLNIGGPF